MAARILALLLEQRPERPLRIALSAPTGKAAARLLEAIEKAKATLDASDDVKAALPGSSSTIHRLLGGMPHSPDFRYHAGRPLPVDVLVIDEASMVDLALFAKLLAALPLPARLILLGDKDQLASVEAGSVLGDICDAAMCRRYTPAFINRCWQITGEQIPPAFSAGPSFADAITILRRSFRFDETSGIRALSLAVNEGRGEQALTLLREGHFPDIVWHDLPRPEAMAESMEETIHQGYGPILKATDPKDAFRLFNHFQVICALREGPYGALPLNERSERVLRFRRPGWGSLPWYAGRPVMILRNDYGLRLFNGDIGIILPDPAMNGELRAFFPAEGAAFRSFPVTRLPEHETVFVMTVHKSQGSEFDNVHLILPDQDAPLLTRELIYTAVTRARQSIHIWGAGEVFLRAVARRTERSSGLHDALWPI
jgi:exodeoxyribonuclease V alpha subunit